ncbi:hypothetical protein CLF_108078 [Clonorchis sinensis]|uniref:Uncharacterized protein n=1 Tax=Clonorchis sinensis TaxID=79923 RepID=G7YHK5_CLOSI|nr:hypothetical protein CLF_108078 [Clonorchis sinensis]
MNDALVVTSAATKLTLRMGEFFATVPLAQLKPVYLSPYQKDKFGNSWSSANPRNVTRPKAWTHAESEDLMVCINYYDFHDLDQQYEYDVQYLSNNNSHAVEVRVPVFTFKSRLDRFCVATLRLLRTTHAFIQDSKGIRYLSYRYFTESPIPT